MDRPDDQEGVERFVWPPRSPDRPVGVEHQPEDPARTGETVRADTTGLTHWIRQAECAWLGSSGRSWRDAATRDAWVADCAESACPRCGGSVGLYEADLSGCPACRRLRLPWVRCVRLGVYEGVLRDAVLAAKLTAWRRVGQDLGKDLGERVAAALRESAIPPDSVVVCPVATSSRRRLSRGVDHTLVLAREVARATGGRVARGLARSHRPTQTGLSANARRENVSGSFRARTRVCKGLSGRVVVLVDDVRSTGATMRAAARALSEGVRASNPGGDPPILWAAVVGVTPRKRR